MRRNLENEVAQRKQTEQALIEAREQALAATAAKESFLANMSHAIRTPLIANMGFAEHALDYDSANKLLCYRVKDSGIGMKPEQQVRIFEPFRQVDSSITRRYGGTGLGLSRRLAELLGGTSGVTSEPGVGREFVLSVTAGDSPNRVMVQNAGETGQNDKVSDDKSAYQKLQGRVLLAEDNENNQRLLTMYLDKMGLQVSHAENGAVAVRLASNELPDLILMDMQMPVLSGLDAARQIRANGYTRPVIALTANATQEDRRRCLEAGCDDFLSKPVRRHRLYQMLAKYLNRQTLPQSGVEPLPSELSDEGPEFVEIVCQFVRKLPEQVAAIEAAYRQHDLVRLHEVVHNLKGMGGGFGYPQLSEKAVEIERLLDKDEYAAVASVIAVLQQLTRRIQAAMPLCMSP